MRRLWYFARNYPHVGVLYQFHAFERWRDAPYPLPTLRACICHEHHPYCDCDPGP